MVSAWDVADACVLAADSPASRGAVLNLGSENPPTVRAQVEALIAHAGSPSRVVTIPAALLRTAARTLDLVRLSPIVPEHYLLADSTFVLDVTRAKELLGWRPKHDNVRMTCDAYDWYVQNLTAARPRRGLVLRLLDALP
jgi:nucleoside-diphosphate-sugar epimerase